MTVPTACGPTCGPPQLIKNLSILTLLAQVQAGILFPERGEAGHRQAQDGPLGEGNLPGRCVWPDYSFNREDS